MHPLRDDTRMAVRAAGVARVLAQPDRLRLVAALCASDATAAELGARLWLPPSRVVRHLAPLLAARLVGTMPGPGAARYHVQEPALHGILACLEDCAP